MTLGKAVYYLGLFLAGGAIASFISNYFVFSGINWGIFINAIALAVFLWFLQSEEKGANEKKLVLCGFIGSCVFGIITSI